MGTITSFWPLSNYFQSLFPWCLTSGTGVDSSVCILNNDCPWENNGTNNNLPPQMPSCLFWNGQIWFTFYLVKLFTIVPTHKYAYHRIKKAHTYNKTFSLIYINKIIIVMFLYRYIYIKHYINHRGTNMFLIVALVIRNRAISVL